MMTPVPAPPKKTVVQKQTGKTVTINPKEKKPRVIPERLTHKPFQEHPELNELRDILEFAPCGEEHAPKKEVTR